MWSKEKNRKTEKVDSLVGRQTTLQGDVRFQGGLHVDGTIRGNIIAEEDDKATLSLSEHGVVEGEVNVPFVLLNGLVKGDVYSRAHVELAAGARVLGNVQYNLIEMALGAQVNGKLVRRPGDAEEDSPVASTAEAGPPDFLGESKSC